MQKWNDINKKTPKESGKYLIYIDGIILCVEYSKKRNLFNCSDSFDASYIGKIALYPTHWMNMPKPPKRKRGNKNES